MVLENRAGAWRLLNKDLDNGWKIVDTVGWDAATGDKVDVYNGTGGNFSVPYIVEKDGRRAFLKAIDLTSALKAVNVLEELNKITSAHSFESRILTMCQKDRMDRVVVALESGQVSVGPNLQDKAPYLIFELAQGDVRKRIKKQNETFRLAYWLRAMHHIAVGLKQLHTKRIAHQDLKPSNVLSFRDDGDFKISDLGRSICDGTIGPYDDWMFSGDWGYAPPEILYGQLDPDWSKRRLGCDMYMLGSMIFFFVTGFGCTQQLVARLDHAHKPRTLKGNWNGDYPAILPVIQNHFTELLSEIEQAIAVEVRETLIKAASELCNPDANLRGHPLERKAVGSQHSLERYVSMFDRLAKQMELVARMKVGND